MAQKRGLKNWWLGRGGLVDPEFLFAGIFVSDAYYRHGCENDDTECANFESQYYEQVKAQGGAVCLQNLLTGGKCLCKS